MDINLQITSITISRINFGNKGKQAEQSAVTTSLTLRSINSIMEWRASVTTNQKHETYFLLKLAHFRRIFLYCLKTSKTRVLSDVFRGYRNEILTWIGKIPSKPWCFNLLLPVVPFLYTLKTSENYRFPDVFRGCKKGKPGSNGLKL